MKFRKYLLGISVLFFGLQLNVSAAEYSVTPTDAVLFSTPEAVLYADADVNAELVLTAEAFPDDTEIHVTGVTDNGFFQVDVGGIYYIPGNGLVQYTQEQQVDIAFKQRQQDVYNLLISFKSQFPEGMRFTNDDYYPWNGGYYIGGYGCAGFAFHLSDAAFGTKIATIHKDYSKLYPGDILRINHDTHSVIILEVKENSVIVAEANYNSSVHWGREISKAAIQDEYSYIMTRY